MIVIVVVVVTVIVFVVVMAARAVHVTVGLLLLGRVAHLLDGSVEAEGHAGERVLRGHVDLMPITFAIQIGIGRPSGPCIRNCVPFSIFASGGNFERRRRIGLIFCFSP